MSVGSRLKNFFRIGPGRPTVLDARANTVPLFNPGNPLLMARAEASGSDADTFKRVRRSVWKSIPLVSWFGLALQAILMAVAVVAMFYVLTQTPLSGTSWSQWILPVYLTASSAYGLLFLWSRTRSLHAVALRRGFLACQCCASCGYPLKDLEPEPDGCTVCPECGAAWRSDTGLAGLEKALEEQVKRLPRKAPGATPEAK